jgi:hypothetical protein
MGPLIDRFYIINNLWGAAVKMSMFIICFSSFPLVPGKSQLQTTALSTLQNMVRFQSFFWLFISFK